MDEVAIIALSLTALVMLFKLKLLSLLLVLLLPGSQLGLVQLVLLQLFPEKPCVTTEGLGLLLSFSNLEKDEVAVTALAADVDDASGDLDGGLAAAAPIVFVTLEEGGALLGNVAMRVIAIFGD